MPPKVVPEGAIVDGRFVKRYPGRRVSPRMAAAAEIPIEGDFVIPSEFAEDGPDDEIIPNTGGLTRAQHRASLVFPVGHPFAGQRKQQAAEEHFEWFEEEAARIAVDMEQGIWIDPRTGQPLEGGRFITRLIAVALGFSPLRPLSFMKDPRFSRKVQWERVRREADMRMSSMTVRPLVSVATGAMLMELLNRVLNHPEKISDRELITETRKYVEMMLSGDAGNEKKPHIQQTLMILQQNINGLPESSRLKVRKMLGNELERGLAALREVAGQVAEVAS